MITKTNKQKPEYEKEGREAEGPLHEREKVGSGGEESRTEDTVEQPQSPLPYTIMNAKGEDYWSASFQVKSLQSSTVNCQYWPHACTNKSFQNKNTNS